MALLALSILLIIESPPYYRGLVINEIVCGATHDWVELMFTDTSREKIDISSLFVTMYYGSSEPLASEPVSIYSSNRSETPYDDRFVVIYPARPGITDETDSTGDTNGNGIIELYCNNYFGSFWNTDCVAAIDTDNNISNGGIVDFAAYSSRGSQLNSSMFKNMRTAADLGEWTIYSIESPELSAVDIGPNGLSSYMSISRRPGTDTNSLNDFYVTKFQTPGRENIEIINHEKNALFTSEKKRITVIPGDKRLSEALIKLTAFENLQIKLRIFTSDGRLVYQPQIIRDVTPGPHVYRWDPGRAASGLYLCRIEAVDRKIQRSQSETVVIIVSRIK